jgi:hypothetical protein
MRGYETAEVDRAIDELLAERRRLTEERDVLQARLDALGERDLATELSAVSKDTAEILETARQAAGGMRDRAAADAARWRREATEAAAKLIQEAEGDAVAMRRSAWDAGTQLLADVDADVASQRSELERETVERRAASEREAHRHVTLAKSEAEEIVTRAKTTADDAVEEARRRREEIGEQIRTSVEQAEEKISALEERRTQLVAEARQTEAELQTLDDEIAARRQRLEVVDLEIPGEVGGAGEPLGFRVIPVHTRTDEEPSVADEEQLPVDALTMADEVRRLRRQADAEKSGPATAAPPAPAAPVETLPEAREKAAPAEVTPAAEAPETEPGPEPSEPVPVPVVAGPGPVLAGPAEPITALPSRDDLAPLFAALRVPSTAAQEDAPVAPPVEVEPEPAPSVLIADLTGDDRAALELRDQLLLPITNRVLRDLKRQLTEAQNLALEQLRLSNEHWIPDADELEARLHPDLVVLAQEAFGAGHLAAATPVGVEATRPRPQPGDLPDPTPQLASDLAAELAAASSGEVLASTAVSRVYRHWRTDEVERRVRSHAIAAYHRGLRRAVLEADPESALRVVPSGRIHPECAQAAAAGPFPAKGAVPGLGDLPPMAADCGCTVVPVG